MAKRRNLKKEKAQRNLAYARKFRKQKNTGSFFKNRRSFSGGIGRTEQNDKPDENATSEETPSE